MSEKTDISIRNMTERSDLIRKYVDLLDDATSSDISLLSKRAVKFECPPSIVVLGCGGTGSWVAPKLIKLLNDAISKQFFVGRIGVDLVFIDGDIVEEKNLIRQNFIEADIGKKKAEVMASRYGQHAVDGMRVGFCDTYLVNDEYKIPAEHADLFGKMSNLDVFKKRCLIINLIDNGKTRKMIHGEAIKRARVTSNRGWTVIDVANNEYNGQLNLTCYSSKNASVYLSRFYNQLPIQLAENDDISAFSCADADAEETDQLFNANDMAASVLGTYLNSWIVNKKLKYGRVDFCTGLAPSIVSSVPFVDGFDVGTSNIPATLAGVVNEARAVGNTYGNKFLSEYDKLDAQGRMEVEVGYTRFHTECYSRGYITGYETDLVNACEAA